MEVVPGGGKWKPRLLGVHPDVGLKEARDEAR
jgi:hypothetical protein